MELITFAPNLLPVVGPGAKESPTPAEHWDPVFLLEPVFFMTTAEYRVVGAGAAVIRKPVSGCRKTVAKENITLRETATAMATVTVSHRLRL